MSRPTKRQRLDELEAAARTEGLEVLEVKLWDRVRRNPTQRGRVGFIKVRFAGRPDVEATLNVRPHGEYDGSIRWGAGRSTIFPQRDDGPALAKEVREDLDGTAAREAEEERLAKIAEKGHDCWDDGNVCHGIDEGRDYYYCGLCDELLQVG